MGFYYASLHLETLLLLTYLLACRSMYRMYGPARWNDDTQSTTPHSTSTLDRINKSRSVFIVHLFVLTCSAIWTSVGLFSKATRTMLEQESITDLSFLRFYRCTLTNVVLVYTYALVSVVLMQLLKRQRGGHVCSRHLIHRSHEGIRTDRNEEDDNYR